jgi:hypothetical protein
MANASLPVPGPSSTALDDAVVNCYDQIVPDAVLAVPLPDWAAYEVREYEDYSGWVRSSRGIDEWYRIVETQVSDSVLVAGVQRWDGYVFYSDLTVTLNIPDAVNDLNVMDALIEDMTKARGLFARASKENAWGRLP